MSLFCIILTLYKYRMVIYLTIPIIMTIMMTLYKYGMVIYLKIPIIMNIINLCSFFWVTNVSADCVSEDAYILHTISPS